MDFRTKREAMRKREFTLKKKIVYKQLIPATAVTPRTITYSSECSQNLHEEETSVRKMTTHHHYVSADSAAQKIIKKPR